jgi:hypothetical protein
VSYENFSSATAHSLGAGVRLVRLGNTAGNVLSQLEPSMPFSRTVKDEEGFE